MESNQKPARVAILGAGNIGQALARGLVEHGGFAPQAIVLTRRRVEALDELAREGFRVTTDNSEALLSAPIAILAVEPRQTEALARQLAQTLNGTNKVIVSVATGVPIHDLDTWLDQPGTIRAMPNTAAALGQSMTCLTKGGATNDDALLQAQTLFGLVGETLEIEEELMTQATALAACGIAFFLRAIRAASQGGIEIGFHPQEALKLAAQTALGAASLVSQGANPAHPEAAIDAVTTPRGCTIAGLNEMEHRGFSSAIIRGIVTSAQKAGA
ncbi:MAG: pyrroline-5-carboxylate reductase [Planctomycetes bacterium]|nr:pyrroline-5-carboxylate reductase [Planctomycetota bacterium]